MKRLLLVLAAAAVSAPAQTAWYNASWQYRKAISIPAGRVLDSPPMLVDLSGDLDVASRTRADCHDVLFTSADGTTRLAHEIDTCRATPCDRTSTASGQCFLFHVAGALAAGSADSVIFVYFGNPYASDQSNAAAVWPSGYENVYHFSGAGLTDSTSHGRNCSLGSGTATMATGQLGDAIFYNRATYLSCVTASTFTAYTAEFWFKAVNEPEIWGNKDYPAVSTASTIVNSPASTNQVAFSYLWDNSNNAAPGPVQGGNWVAYTQVTRYMTGAKWYYVAIVSDGVTTTQYVNGLPWGSGSVSGINPAGTLTIGGNLPWFSNGVSTCAGAICFQGWIDEVRISSVVRPASYIATQWSNIFAPGDFYKIGALEVKS